MGRLMHDIIYLISCITQQFNAIMVSVYDITVFYFSLSCSKQSLQFISVC